MIKPVQRNFLLLTGILILVFATYWPGLHGGFVFDDYANLVFNRGLHVTRLVWGEWVTAAFSSISSDLQRPLAMLSFAINHYFTGLDPWPMKLTNVGIHALNTALVFGLARMLVRSLPVSAQRTANHHDYVALFVSACWALLPINLIAVLLVVQRMEILSHTFVFAGLWLYLVGRFRQLEGRGGWVQIGIALALGTGLGTLSKESAVLLPLYAALVEVLILGFRRSGTGRDSKLIGLFALVLVIPAVIGVYWLAPKALDPAAWAHRNFTLAERLLTEPRIVVDYFRWTVAPDLSRLSLFHDDYPVSRGLWNPPATIVGLFGIAALVFAAWRLRRRRPLSSLGLAWFLAAQLLTGTFLPLELVFEHRNYFASLGIALLLADLLLVAPSASGHRKGGQVVAGLLLVFYAGTTHLRALEWSNPIRFAQTEAAKHPQSPRATYHWAQQLAILSEGKPDSVFTPAAFAAFDRARHVPRASIAPSQGALLLAARSGTPMKDEWWADMQQHLRNDPVGPQELGALGALTDCAIASQCSFPRDQMIATYAAALSRGDIPEVLNVYGNYVLNVLGEIELAENLWREAARLSPGEPQYVISLAKLMIWSERDQQAIIYIDHLRTMGRFGQNQAAADALQTRLVDAVRSRKAP